MTRTVQVVDDGTGHAGPGGAGPGADAPVGPPLATTWTLRRRGVATVTALELRQRVRSTRWRLALGIWFVLVGLVTWLSFSATASVVRYAADDATVGGGDPGTVVDAPARGPLIFGLVMFFVLLAGLLVAPTLSAGSINGDRTAGTLATLQVTLLSPAEIAVGKLLAGWGAAVAFLVASLPFLALALAAGGVRVASFVVTLVLLVVLLGVVCAIGLGCSALVARTTASALLTYLSVLGLVLGTLIVFGLTLPLVTQHDEVPTWTDAAVAVADDPTGSPAVVEGSVDAATGRPLDPRDDGDAFSSVATACTLTTEPAERQHTERTWWLLAPNPFVVVADAAPAGDPDVSFSLVDPLAEFRSAVRAVRAGPPPVQSWCSDGPADVPTDAARAAGAPVWPWGLGVDVLLGAAGVWVAVRRLRIPQTRLVRGTRVA